MCLDSHHKMAVDKCLTRETTFNLIVGRRSAVNWNYCQQRREAHYFIVWSR